MHAPRPGPAAAPIAGALARLLTARPALARLALARLAIVVATVAMASACGTTVGEAVGAGAPAQALASTADGAPEDEAGSGPPLSARGPRAPLPPATEVAPPTAQPAPPTLAPPSAEPPTTLLGGRPPPTNIYAETMAGVLAPTVADVPARVYVPSSEDDTVSVIDPATLSVVDTFAVDRAPHHVVASWDLQTLWVLNSRGNTITPIDPRRGEPGPARSVRGPSNLYFTPDGSVAVVVAERQQRLDLYDPQSWQLRGSIPVPHPGLSHGDFSEDGRFFYASCERSGWVVKVDVVEQRIAAQAQVGALPVDVRLSPDTSVLYVADRGRNGVLLLDPSDLGEVGFRPTGRGARGLVLSRDTSRLFVANALEGSISVLDLASRDVVGTWRIPGGGSPDAGAVSADGSQLWLAGRYHDEVYVIDTADGRLIRRIPVGGGPHGLAVFPQPGRFSLGHGLYR